MSTQVDIQRILLMKASCTTDYIIITKDKAAMDYFLVYIYICKISSSFIEKLSVMQWGKWLKNVINLLRRSTPNKLENIIHML